MLTRDDFKPNPEEVNREPTSQRFTYFPLCICYELFSEVHDAGVAKATITFVDIDGGTYPYGDSDEINVSWVPLRTGQKFNDLVHPMRTVILTATYSFKEFLRRRLAERSAQYRDIPAERRPFISRYVAKPDYLNWCIQETIYTCTPKKTRGTI